MAFGEGFELRADVGRYRQVQAGSAFGWVCEQFV
jgi:hypothetical protein